MKNKNVILSLAVLVASIGTALATSFLVPQPTWVHGTKIVSPGVFAETCSTLGNKCEPTGARNCEIVVSLSGVSTSTIGYANNICTIPLRLAEDADEIDDGKNTVYTEIDPYQPN